MSGFVREFKFKITPHKLEYFDNEPLKLTKDFSFFHNKSKFRKELNRLQNLFKENLNNSLVASGIRDSYLKDEYAENFLLVIFTTPEIIKDANQIVESLNFEELKSGCFSIESSSEYIILIAKDMNGLISGIHTLEEIFQQTFEDYFNQKRFQEYIKIRPFKLISCP